MKKRDILMGLVGIAGVVNIIFSRVVSGYPPLLELFLTIPFYIIILIFYRKTKLITAFSIFTILSQFGYYMVLANMQSHAWLDVTMRIFGSFSFFSGLIGFFLAFGLVLQHKTYKFTELSFFAFSILNYVFFSYFTFYLRDMLITIFGPFEIHIIKMFYVYYGVEIAAEISILVLQVLVIFFLERNKLYERRLMLKDKKIMNSSIAD